MQPGITGATLCLAALLCAAALCGCDNNPNPAPLAKVRADGTPWRVRYAGLPEDPRSLDPQVSYDQLSRRILEPVQECLLEYHPFKTDPYEVVPCLLDEMPAHAANADGTVTYVCKLKRGIFFHDDPCFPGEKGRELTAADAVFAFKRIADPKVECPVVAALAEYLPGLGEAYAAAQKRGTFDYSQSIRGVEQLDSHTFSLRLAKPYPQIIYWLAMHVTAPVAREAVEYYDGKAHDGATRDLFKFHPVGTGPFRIAEWKRTQRFRLVRNDRYSTTRFPGGGWEPGRESFLRPLAGSALPLVDEVQMAIFREAIPVFLLTRQGYLDGMGVGKDAFGSMMTASRRLAPKYTERGMTLHKDTDASTFFLSFNMQDPLIGGNKKLRQALASAFDRQSYIDIFANGVPVVAEQLVPPGIYGHQRDFKNPFGFNMERARRLIAEAGYPNGRDPKTGQPLQITMDTTADSSDARQMAEYEQRQFEQLGIRVKIIENNFARMLEKEDHGDFQIASGTGWGADYPDPENFLFLFNSGNFPPSGKNISRYKNDEFDRLFAGMATMENSPERMEIVSRMNALLAGDVPVLLTFHRASFAVTQPWAPRVCSNPMLEGGIKYAMVDPAMRERKQREWNKPVRWPAFAALGLVLAGGIYGAIWNRRRNV
jgi:ABC-type transport system substrate-binding protein